MKSLDGVGGGEPSALLLSPFNTKTKSRLFFKNLLLYENAGMAELVYALVLGTSGATLGSSSLPPSTPQKTLIFKPPIGLDIFI